MAGDLDRDFREIESSLTAAIGEHVTLPCSCRRFPGTVWPKLDHFPDWSIEGSNWAPLFGNAEHEARKEHEEALKKYREAGEREFLSDLNQRLKDSGDPERPHLFQTIRMADGTTREIHWGYRQPPPLPRHHQFARPVDTANREAYERFKTFACTAGDLLCNLPPDVKTSCNISPATLAVPDAFPRWLSFMAHAALNRTEGLTLPGIAVKGENRRRDEVTGKDIPLRVEFTDVFRASRQVVEWLIEQCAEGANVDTATSGANGEAAKSRCSLDEAERRVNQMISSTSGRALADSLSQRDLSDRIKCSEGTLAKTSYWQNERAGKSTPRGAGKRKTIRLTRKLESMLGVEDETLNDLLNENTPQQRTEILEMMRDADYEPSPLDEDP